MAAKLPVAITDFTTLDEWLAWQESLHVRDIELGLERCRSVAAAMGLTRAARTVVTVAGTNGKGSSVAMLEAIWRNAGYRTGTYTSPHLLRYNERIRLDGEAVDDAAICAAFRRVERVRDDVPLTYFEFGTLAALAIFADADLDVAILEVGLGGRLDAVNIVDADCALIATIGIDHIEYLGDTREQIGREKAGIMRPDRPAVCSDPMMPDSIRTHAAAIGCHLDVLGETFRYADEGNHWTWWRGDRVKSGLPYPGLVGAYQLRNAAGVIRVVDILDDRLPVADTVIAAALEQLQLPGRFQRVAGEVEVIMDVAHNAQAVEAFVHTLESLPPASHTHVVLGMLRVKDRDGVIRQLAPIADTWHLATVVARRGATSDELAASLGRVVAKPRRAHVYDSVGEAFRGARAAAAPGHRIVALGSFLVVSEVMACLA